MGTLDNILSRRWSSRDLRPEEHFDAWSAALNDSHLNWSLDREKKGRAKKSFYADLEVSNLPDMNLIQCHCQPCSGYRGRRQISTETKAFYGILLMYSGQEEITVKSATSLVRPGQIFLWDSTEPISFRLRSPVEKITALIPQKRLEDALPLVSNLTGQSLDWRQGMGAVVSSHIKTLCAQAPCIPSRHARSTSEITLGLISDSLGTHVGTPENMARTALVERIRAHIETHLDDPNLGPGTLAAAFNISLRYLHQLFATEEHTVARWIQERRLERCRRDLSLQGRHRNITEIALRWGFNDAAHFSRVFRKRYGLSPRQYRQKRWN